MEAAPVRELRKYERVQLGLCRADALVRPRVRSSLVMRRQEVKQDAGGGARATLAASADPS